MENRSSHQVLILIQPLSWPLCNPQGVGLVPLHLWFRRASFCTEWNVWLDSISILLIFYVVSFQKRCTACFWQEGLNFCCCCCFIADKQRFVSWWISWAQSFLSPFSTFSLLHLKYSIAEFRSLRPVRSSGYSLEPISPSILCCIFHGMLISYKQSLETSNFIISYNHHQRQTFECIKTALNQSEAYRIIPHINTQRDHAWAHQLTKPISTQ